MSTAKNSPFKATVVIAFYNKVRFLELVLAGFARQSEKNFEVIIADDGSTAENVQRVKELMAQCPFETVHLWQEDIGFRKNIMLNKSILAARSETVIFVDGDCIPHSHFVAEHVASTQEGFCSSGRRVNLSPEFSEALTAEAVKDGILERSNVRFFIDALRRRGNHSGQGLFIKNGLLRRLLNRRDRGVLGSNFSVNKNDLLSINGFDERYVHPAVGEDTDIEFRLRLKGVRVRYLINMANQYHLYHRLLPREEENPKLFAQVQKEGQFFTRFGIVKSESL
jgi:glycosyltransferase involved in cell wall biosynthesis